MLIFPGGAYSSMMRKNTVFVSSMSGLNNSSDEPACLLQPEKLSCSSLRYTISNILGKELAWINTIILHKNAELLLQIVSLPENYSKRNRRIKIVCLVPCIVENDLLFLAESLHRSLVFEMENITFKNSKITVANVNMIFTSVQFIDTVVTDSNQTSSQLNDVIMHFQNTHFSSTEIKGETCGLFLTNTFSAALTFKRSDFSGAPVKINVQHLILRATDTSFKTSHIALQVDMFCHSKFQNVSLQGQMPSKNNALLFSVTSLKLSISFKFCFFQSNSGGMTFVKNEYHLVESWMQCYLLKCVFVNNTKMGPGGAVAVSFSAPDSRKLGVANYLIVEDCSFANNKATRQGSESSYGGALGIQGLTSGTKCHELDIHIINSSFTNNQATDGGGAIYISESCITTTIVKSTFEVVEGSFEPTKGVFVWSLSGISIQLSLFQNQLKKESPSMLELEMLKSEAIISQLDLTIVCLQWHKLSLTERFAGNQAKELSITCTSCSPSFYVPSDGLFTVSLLPNQSTISAQGTTSNKKELSCLPCPSGAECTGNDLSAKPNFWGSNKDHVITLYQCPSHYCCEADCIGYDQCKQHRTGVLCGNCEEKYSLSMLSPECIEVRECKSYWLWPVVVLAVVLYMTWYTLKDEAFAIPAFLARKLCKKSRSSNSSDIYYIDKGYFGIVTYFVQVKAVMSLSLSLDHTDPADNILIAIESYLSISLNFELSNISNNACALDGLTTTHKTMFKLLFLFGVYLAWNLAFIILYLVTQCMSSANKNTSTLEYFKLRMINGLVEIIKYTYLGFTSIVFFSLTCISVDGNLVWFYYGSVQCYSIWQKLMITFCLVFIFPYPLLVYLGMKLLRKQKISRHSFMVAIYFPLPALLVWIFILNRHGKKKETYNTSTTDKGVVEQTIYDGFKGGFRESEKGTQYWESVLMLRRLILSATFLIPNPISQLYVCLALCVIFLFHHTYMKPFRHFISNITEGLSLSLLCGVAGINLLKAAFLYGEIPHDGPQVEIMYVLEVIETLCAVALILFIVFFEAVVGIVSCARKAMHPADEHTEAQSHKSDAETGTKLTADKHENHGCVAEENSRL